MSSILHHPGGLSRRRVRAVVRIGQRWQRDDRVWIVRNVYRHEGQVSLERVDHRGLAFESFAELGKHYRLLEVG